MYKVVVFDLGGTLMEFKGMPLSWVEYYKFAFENINNKYLLNLNEDDIKISAQKLISLNPRINYREKEIEPEKMFEFAIEHWQKKPDVNDLVNDFFESFQLNAVVFDYSIDLINKFKNRGCKIACLTDLPSGMPDDMFRKFISELEPLFDLYVSSQKCGYRKPSTACLSFIKDKFSVSFDDMLFIGDERKDELTAERAGCDFNYINDLLVVGCDDHIAPQ